MTQLDTVRLSSKLFLLLLLLVGGCEQHRGTHVGAQRGKELATQSSEVNRDGDIVHGTGSAEPFVPQPQPQGQALTPFELAMFFIEQHQEDGGKVGDLITLSRQLIESKQERKALSVLMEAADVTEANQGRRDIRQLLEISSLFKSLEREDLANRFLDLAYSRTERLAKDPLSAFTRLAGVLPSLFKLDSQRALRILSLVGDARIRNQITQQLQLSLSKSEDIDSSVALWRHRVSDEFGMGSSQDTAQLVQSISSLAEVAGNRKALESIAGLISEIDDDFERFKALLVIANSLSESSERNLAAESIEQASELLPKFMDSRADQARSLLARAYAKAGMANRALQIAKEVDQLTLLFSTNDFVASLGEDQSTYLLPLITKFEEDLNQSDSNMVSAMGTVTLASVHLEIGGIERSLKLLEEAAERLRSSEAEFWHSSVWLDIAKNQTRGGDSLAAGESFMQALASAKLIDQTHLTTASLCSIIKEMYKNQQTTEADTAVRDALMLATESGVPSQQIGQLLLIASATAANGNAEIIEEALTTCCNIVETLAPQGRPKHVSIIAIEYAKIEKYEEAKRVIRDLLEDPSEKSAALSEVAEFFRQNGKSSDAFAALRDSLDIAKEILGAKKLIASVERIAHLLVLSGKLERTQGTIKDSFSEAELDLAESIVGIIESKKRALGNLRLANLTTLDIESPDADRLPTLPSSSNISIPMRATVRSGKQFGLLRIEQQADNVSFSGVARNLEPGTYQLLISKPEEMQYSKSILSSLYGRGVEKKSSQFDQHVRLHDGVLVACQRIQRLETNPADETEIDFTLQKVFVKDLEGRALFLCKTDAQEPDGSSESYEASLWSFVLRPEDRFNASDKKLWAEVLPDFSINDLTLSENRASLQVPNSTRGYKRPEGLISLGQKAVSMNGEEGAYLTTDIRQCASLPFTIEAWVKPSDSEGDNAVIGSETQFGATLGVYDGYCKLKIHDGVRYRVLRTEKPLSIKKTSHIAGVFDGKTIALFLDGEKQQEGRIDLSGIQLPESTVLLGAASTKTGLGEFYAGLIDSVRISSAPRYDENFTPEYKFKADENTLAVFSFDEGKGNVATDLSPSGRVARLVGSVDWNGVKARNEPSSDATFIDPRYYSSPNSLLVSLATTLDNLKAKTQLLDGIAWEKISKEEIASIVANLNSSASPSGSGITRKLSPEEKIQLAVPLGLAGDKSNALKLLDDALITIKEYSSRDQRLQKESLLISAFAKLGEIPAAVNLAGDISEVNDSLGRLAPYTYQIRQQSELVLAESMIKAGDIAGGTDRLRLALQWVRNLDDERISGQLLTNLAIPLANVDSIDSIMPDIEQAPSPSKSNAFEKVAALLIERNEIPKALALLNSLLDEYSSLNDSTYKFSKLVRLAKLFREAGSADSELEILASIKADYEIAVDQLLALIEEPDPTPENGSSRYRNNIRFLIQTIPDLHQSGNSDLATSSLRKCLSAIQRSEPELRATGIADILRLASAWRNIGDDKQVNEALHLALQGTKDLPVSNVYSKDNSKADAICSLANFICGQSDWLRLADTREKGDFREYEKEFARELSIVSRTISEVDSARKQLNSYPAPTAFASGNQANPELLWLKALADLKAQFRSVSGLDASDIGIMLSDFGMLISQRNYDQDIHQAANIFIESLERSGKEKQLGELYELLADRMSESSDIGLRNMASRMSGKAAWISLVGKPMKIEGTTVDGEVVNLNSYRGNVVLVDYWASWCQPCRVVHRDLKRKLDEYGDRGFNVISVNVDNNLGDYQDYMVSQDIPWPVIRSLNPIESGTRNPNAARYGLTRLPACILVDREGKVVSRNARGGELEGLLRNLYGESETTGDPAIAGRPSGPKAAMSPNTKLAQSLSQLGGFSMRSGDLDEAADYFQRALEVDREYSPALTGLGDIEIRNGNVDDALVLFRSAIKADPANAVAHNNLAWALVTHPDENGEFKGRREAMLAARKACQLQQDNLGNLNTLGVALYRNEMWDEAITALEDSVNLGADIPHNWIFIGMAKWHRGEKDAAKILLDKSIKWQSQNAPEDNELASFIEEGRKTIAVNGSLETLPQDELDRKSAVPISSTGDLDDARVSFLIQRANGGDVAAMATLGHILRGGEGGTPRPADAFKWDLLAAQLGNSSSQAVVGHSYRTGQGVERDLKEGFKWDLKAAQQGVVTAQRLVGKILYEGGVTNRDPIESYAWLSLAAEAGDEVAKKMCDKLKGELSVTEQAEATNRATNYKSKFSN
ncbi:MAG: LamG-like jellyroll fold domain-containing protein [Rubripirellula sp.]